MMAMLSEVASVNYYFSQDSIVESADTPTYHHQVEILKRALLLPSSLCICQSPSLGFINVFDNSVTHGPQVPTIKGYMKVEDRDGETAIGIATTTQTSTRKLEQ